jgi:hypothetical protein
MAAPPASTSRSPGRGSHRNGTPQQFDELRLEGTIEIGRPFPDA